MRTCLQRIGQDPWFVIYDVEEAYHDTARRLGYGDIAAGFGSVAPADNPFVQRAYDNFQQYVEPMLLQAAGVQPVPWNQTLLSLLTRLDGHDIDWWLLGSAALAVRGLHVTPGDIDLVVSDAGAFYLQELLLDCVVQPVIATPGWVHNSFARAFLHSRIEWVGGVNPIADAEYPSDQGPIAASRLEIVPWRGYEIRVPPLELQLEVSRHRGLTDRVAVIEKALG